jgi:hypothetical protein
MVVLSILVRRKFACSHATPVSEKIWVFLRNFASRILDAQNASWDN